MLPSREPRFHAMMRSGRPPFNRRGRWALLCLCLQLALCPGRAQPNATAACPALIQAAQKPLERAGLCRIGSGSKCNHRGPTCFEMDKCRNFSVYIHQVDVGRQWSFGLSIGWAGDWDYNQYMKAALKLTPHTYPYYTADPEAACVKLVAGLPVFVNGELRSSKVLRWLARLPHWNKGTNHIIVDTMDRWSYAKYHSAAFPVGKALVFKSSVRASGYRNGFDVAVPLPPRKVYSREVRWGAQNRTQLLCWKGEVHTYKRLRTRLLLLNNDEDVIVARKEKTKVDYDTLMRTCKYVMAPRGDGLHSFRLLEIMSAGAVPVIISDTAMKPYADLFDWSRFSIDVKEAKVNTLVPYLRGLTHAHWQRLRDTGRCVYEKFWGSEEDMLRLALGTVQRRIEATNRLCSATPSEK